MLCFELGAGSDSEPARHLYDGYRACPSVTANKVAWLWRHHRDVVPYSPPHALCYSDSGNELVVPESITFLFQDVYMWDDRVLHPDSVVLTWLVRRCNLSEKRWDWGIGVWGRPTSRMRQEEPWVKL